MEKEISQKRIGEILLQDSLITSAQLEKSILLQGRSGRSLVDILVEQGFVSDEALAISLSKTLEIPFASRENRLLKVERRSKLGAVFSERFSREKAVVPLYMEKKALVVATADPGDQAALDEMRSLAGCEIKFLVSTKAQILRALDDLYGADAPADGGGAVSEAQEEVSELFGKPVRRLDLDQVSGSGDGLDVVGFVNAMLKLAISERASSVHLALNGGKVSLRFRIDGKLYDREALAANLYDSLVARIKILAGLNMAEKRVPQEGPLAVVSQGQSVDLTVSCCPTMGGDSLVLRIADKGAAAVEIDRLGLDARQKNDLLRAIKRPQGLILLSGPAGSGKTTTLYSILKALRSPEVKIVTVEEDIPCRLEGVDQILAQAKTGLDFPAALGAVGHQDPDIILVGEIRDRETAEMCLRYALSGRLVFSTLPAKSALEAVESLIDLGIDPFVLSAGLCLTAAQRLIRLLCPACKRPYEPERSLLEMAIKESMLANPGDRDLLVFFQSVGCKKCSNTGFVGVQAVYEVVSINPEFIRLMNKDGGNLPKLKEEARRQRCISLRASAWQKAITGTTSAEEVMSCLADVE